MTEERDFFTSLNEAFFSIYTNGSSCNRAVNGLKKITALAITGIHGLQSYIEEPEQSSGLFSSPAIIDDFYKEPDQSSGEADIFDEAVLL